MRRSPFLLIIFMAIILFVWIRNQRAGNDNNSKEIFNESAFDRTPDKLTYSKHAICRMKCRDIDESEVASVLRSGEVIEKRIRKSSKGISIPMEGYTTDGQHVRIVVAPHADKMVVVTVIDLGRDWECNCD